MGFLIRQLIKHWRAITTQVAILGVLLDKFWDYLEAHADSPAVQALLKLDVDVYIVGLVREKTGMELDPEDPLSKASLGAAIGTKLNLQLDPYEPFSKASIGAAVGRRVGLELDPVDPFSKPSLAAAVGAKIGLDLDANDPFSKESFGNAISYKLGLNQPFRDISNREMFLEDLGQGITNIINNRLGTSFTRLYPVDSTIIQNFEREIIVQLEKAFAGQPSLIRSDSLNMIITRVRTARGNLDPQTVDDAERYIRARAYSRKYYDRQSRAGYSRKWVKVGEGGVLVEYDPAI